MSKATLIREMKEKDPSLKSMDIAKAVGVASNYVSHILWRSTTPHKKKEDYQKAFEYQLAQNEELKKQIEQLEDELTKLRYVIKFLREN